MGEGRIVMRAMIALALSVALHGGAVGCGDREVVDSPRGPRQSPAPTPSVTPTPNEKPTEGAMTSEADKVRDCLRTIDEKPDPGHSERTPSVACLIEIGRPALAPTIPLLSAPSASTRARAQRVIEQITRRSFGFDGKQWSDADRDRWMAWWSQIAYAYDASPDERAAAIARLEAALRSRGDLQ